MVRVQCILSYVKDVFYVGTGKINIMQCVKPLRQNVFLPEEFTFLMELSRRPVTEAAEQPAEGQGGVYVLHQVNLVYLVYCWLPSNRSTSQL